MVDDITLPPSVNPLTASFPSYLPPTPDQPERDTAQRAVAERAQDPTLPIYPTGDDESKDRYLFPVPQDLRDRFDTLCQDAAPNLSDTYRMVDDDFEILRHAIIMLTELLPLNHDAHHAALIWAWMRVVCAGAGYKRHAELAKELCIMFPLCPLDHTETYKGWTKELNEAHSSCGWPVGISWLDFKEVHDLYPVTEFKQPPDKWMRVLALIHVVKHTRICCHDVEGAAYQYRGQWGKIYIKSKSEAMTPSSRNQLTCALGGIRIYAKINHLLSEAMRSLMSTLPVGRLLPVYDIADLDPHFLVAPSADICPWPENRQGFCRTGVGMRGVWYANKGDITKVMGRHKLSLSTYWPDPKGDESDFAAILPTTYNTTKLPALLMREAFPNLVPVGDPVAYDAIVSAVLLSGLMNRGLFNHERPIMAAMPTDTTDITKATNTGKSTLAVAIARVFSPSIEGAQRVSTGAPAQRSAMKSLNRHGTVALDEFQWAKDESSLFSEPNMLAMVTGNSPNIGNVLSNEEVMARLTAPITLSVKVLEGKIDTFSRTIPLPLRQFTMMERANPQFNDIARGKWSIAIRMTCLHIIDTFNLNEMLAHANPSGGHFRFNYLRHLSALLYIGSCGKPMSMDEALLMIDTNSVLMTDYMQERYNDAVASGTLSEAKGTGQAAFNLDAMINDMNMTEIDHFCLECSVPTNPRDIFQHYKRSKGWDNRPDASVFEDLTGCENVKGQRLARTVGNELKQLVPKAGDTYQLPGAAGIMQGWHLVRMPDRARYTWFQIEQRQQNPQSNPMSTGATHARPTNPDISISRGTNPDGPTAHDDPDATNPPSVNPFDLGL